jgi:threonine dehydratase
MTAPGLPEIEAARARLDGVARVTPVYGSETLSQLAGRETKLKAENLQRTGSFKIRGAYNRISRLSAGERAAGVVAASAGNHGQAVAWAAREVGAVARIFMPQDAPMAKVEATRHYGAEVVLGGTSLEECLESAAAYVAEHGATFIHPFEDPLVIAGQATIGLELAEQVPEAETVLIPVGGGGLASGIALALRASKPGIRIVGVQAEGTRPGGSGFTIADGIAVKSPGELTTSILDDVLDDMVSVTDEQISEAIVLLLERTKLVVEGAGAVSVAALLAG